jgi:hypothetical protein
MPYLPEFTARRPRNLYTCRSSALCPANARTAIVRVANAQHIVCSVLLSQIDARHKNYNHADFSLPRNSFTDNVWWRAAATRRGKIRETVVYCGPESKLLHGQKFASTKMRIFAIKKSLLLKNGSFLTSDLKNLKSVGVT